MLIPDGTPILTWCGKYFVDSVMSTELITDEDVRVLWYEDRSDPTGNPNVFRKKMCFDIYVRRERLNDVTKDRLQSRARLISQRLQELLTEKPQVGQIDFDYADDYSLGTKMVGYVRHHLILTYQASYK